MDDKAPVTHHVTLRGEKVLLKYVAKEVKEEVANKSAQKLQNIKAYRTEASRLASMANKRLKRLEKNGLKDSPAYQKWLSTGGEKFGIRGKTYNQVQSEVARMRQFINSETSTVRGVNRVLKEMAKNTGLKYKNLAELRASADKFFNLASKIEQYLRTVEDMASAIGYQKIWEAINVYIKNEKVALDNANVDIEELTKKIVEAMDEHQKKEKITVTGAVTGNGWYKLE